MNDAQIKAEKIEKIICACERFNNLEQTVSKCENVVNEVSSVVTYKEVEKTCKVISKEGDRAICKTVNEAKTMLRTAPRISSMSV